MTIYERQLLDAGFVQQPDGSWSKTGADVRDRYSGQTPFMEQHPVDGSMGAVQIQNAIGGRFLIRVTSYRHRLLDEDNLCEKFHVDLCRYAGILSSDAPGKSKIEVSQQKVPSKDKEFVRIEILR